MRTRLHIQFNPISGQSLLSEMRDDNGNLYPEEVIEDVYKVNISDCTIGKVHTVKQPASGRRKTDGWMTFKYTDSVPGFEGIQECKRGNAASIKKLNYQLAQAIKYYWEICVKMKTHKEKRFKVFCLNSEKYFAYVYKDELEEMLEELNPLFLMDDCPPNELANKPWEHRSIIDVIAKYNIPYKIKEMPTEVELSDIFRSIYLHCL